ncbi:MAG: alanine racemase [Pseudomonadota bacterium]
MGAGCLEIDLGAIVANWRALDGVSAPGIETGAVVKADAYGLGIAPVAAALAEAGARSFFVAQAAEAGPLRQALGTGPQIFVFSGCMAGDGPLLEAAQATPLLNAPEQVLHWAERGAFGVQLDTGMHRLGFQPGVALPEGAVLTISHLACADEPEHPQNAAQLAAFQPEGRASLAATGGTVMGPAYHFDLTRPGIGLYGGLPFEGARPVVRLSLPVIQVRDVPVGGAVGYGATWVAKRPSRVATVSAGYADGLIRAMGPQLTLWADDLPCPHVGRVSMDLLTVDVTDLPEVPESLDILGPHQTIDQLAHAAGTIGYEILTSLGARYERRYIGANTA